MGADIIFTLEMGIVVFILILTIIMFVLEIFRVDVTAIIILLLLVLISPLLSVLSPVIDPVLRDAFSDPYLTIAIDPLVPKDEIFSGFAKDAVISIIAVMIIGAALDRTGIMGKVANFILKVGGKSESRIIPTVSSTVGVISSFMQNVGAAALFLPVMSKLSNVSKIPLSRLLMPMGFCAILGGTLTMVGSTSLILLNSLIADLDSGVLKDNPIGELGLFAPAPIGIALLLTGILYFSFFGKYVLPQKNDHEIDTEDPMKYFQKQFGLHGEIFELQIKDTSDLIGQHIHDIQEIQDSPFVLAMHDSKTFLRFVPDSKKKIEFGGYLAVMGSTDKIKSFAHKYDLEIAPELEVFKDSFDKEYAGIAEIVVKHESEGVGKTIPQLRLPSNAQFSFLKLYRGEKVIEKDFGRTPLQPGDTIVMHTTWKTLDMIQTNKNFLVASDFEYKQEESHKIPCAVFSFILTLLLILTKDILGISLATALLVGAMSMVLLKVISIDNAYKSVDWKTVFLLACLIPLGKAVNDTGTANWIASSILGLFGGEVSSLVLQIIVALLATFFTLVMSNAGATVLLVPLAVILAVQAGENPLIYALIVGICTSNSFILPTHHVNALLMGPGGYKVKDYLRAGGIMTVLFLIVTIGVINLMF